MHAAARIPLCQPSGKVLYGMDDGIDGRFYAFPQKVVLMAYVEMTDRCAALCANKGELSP